MISAVAVVSVKSPDSKKIYDLGVFGVTAITSLFAYVWLYIVLKVWTENEVTIWEACITLAFFFILLIAAFIADKINACCKKKKEGNAWPSNHAKRTQSPLLTAKEVQSSRGTMKTVIQ